MQRYRLLLVAGLLACGGGLTLHPIKATSGKPSNVAVYFRVEGGKDEPIGGLTSESFRIYEDGSLVSTFESKQTIVNPEVAAAHYTVLLLDMSGSITESGTTDALIEAATAFTERIEKQHKVAVFAFDGSEQLHTVSGFTSSGGAKAAIRSLAGFKPRDPSTNLNGAIVAGVHELDQGLARAEQPTRFGTIVVFSDGTDRAHRVKENDMQDVLRKSGHAVFAIGLGQDLSESQLKSIGRDGTARAENKETVGTAFDKIAARIESRTKSYYLLSYCTPARAGKHRVKIEAIAKSADGKSERTGTLQQEFDAEGFGPGCDPNTPPPFDVRKGDLLAPKEVKEEKKEEKPKAKTIRVQGGASGSTTPTATATAKPAASAGGDVFNP